MSTQTILETPRQTVFNLGPASDVPFGLGRCFQVMGEEIAVFRQRDGRIFAVQNRCPHRGGPLADGLAGNGSVVCPLHAHKFDLCSGKGSEVHECVKSFRVTVVGGDIHLSGGQL